MMLLRGLWDLESFRFDGFSVTLGQPVFLIKILKVQSILNKQCSDLPLYTPNIYIPAIHIPACSVVQSNHSVFSLFSH